MGTKTKVRRAFEAGRKAQVDLADEIWKDGLEADRQRIRTRFEIAHDAWRKVVGFEPVKRNQ